MSRTSGAIGPRGLIHHPSVVPDEPTRTLSGWDEKPSNSLPRGIRRDLDAPQVSLVIYWLCHDLMIAAPRSSNSGFGIRGSWRREAGRSRPEANLRWGEDGSHDRARLGGVSGRIHKGGRQFRVSLLTSLSRAPTQGKVKKEHFKRIKPTSSGPVSWRRFPNEPGSPLGLRISTAGPLELVQAARAGSRAAGKASGRPRRRSATICCSNLDFADILRLATRGDEKRNESCRYPELYSPTSDVHRAVREAAAREPRRNQDLFRFVLLWLTKLLQNSVEDSKIDRSGTGLCHGGGGGAFAGHFFQSGGSRRVEPLLILTAKCDKFIRRPP